MPYYLLPSKTHTLHCQNAIATGFQAVHGCLHFIGGQALNTRSTFCQRRSPAWLRLRLHSPFPPPCRFGRCSARGLQKSRPTCRSSSFLLEVSSLPLAPIELHY